MERMPRRRPGHASLRLLALAVGLATLATVPAHAAGRASAAAVLPRAELLERALAAYRRVLANGQVANPVLTVIDYSLPSSRRRLWVVDPETRRVLAHEYVAHGRGSGDERDPARAVRFGNQPSSHRTSLGTFLTGDTYTGQHGLSLELDGLDPGVNDRARERRIVIHPADYVSAAFRARSGGWVGRSFGCPALAPDVAPRLIERIRGGSVLFAGRGEEPATVAQR
ncbi:MAG: murein L,D-transpeptidase catalytic domain family protein [Deltaproteobacteria bacterium]|nr:murein L,D-transpeptidase catalytic domain family protein [Deltaproteobacteria bacterium]